MATILVADDELLVREGVADFLVSAGHRVLRASNAAEVRLRLAEAGHVDWLLLDRSMPGVNGVALAGDLRAEGLKARIVLMTGDDIDASALGASGIERVLGKPFPLDALAFLG